MIKMILIGWLVVGMIASLWVLIHGYVYHKWNFKLEDTVFALYGTIGGLATLCIVVNQMRIFFNDRNKAKR